MLHPALFRIPHAQTIIAACSEDLQITECFFSIRDIDEYIAMVLGTVVVSVARVSSATAKGGLEGVLYMILRTDVHKGAVLLRHGSIIAIESYVGIVIVTITTAEDGINTTDGILHIG